MKQTLFLGNDLWGAINKIGKSSPKQVAVAYFSDSHAIPFGKDDIIITSASEHAIKSAQTSAQALLQAHKRGAKVYSHPNLHAKLFHSEEAAIISSANLSKSSKGLREAGILSREKGVLSQVKSYIRQLRGESELLGTKELSQLALLPVLRSQGIQTGGVKPSLLEALKANLDVLDNVGFTWYTNEKRLSKKEVAVEAMRRNVHLPKGKMWFPFETVDSPGYLKKTRAYNSVALVSWEAKIDEKDEILRFMAHDDSAGLQVDAFSMKKLIVSIVSRHPARTPFNLRKDRSILAGVLNKGLKKASSGLRKAINNDLGILTRTQLIRLVELGQ